MRSCDCDIAGAFSTGDPFWKEGVLVGLVSLSLAATQAHAYVVSRQASSRGVGAFVRGAAYRFHVGFRPRILSGFSVVLPGAAADTHIRARNLRSSRLIFG